MPLRVGSRGGKLTIVGTVRPAGAAKGIEVRRRAGTDNPALAREEAAALETQILRDWHHGKRRADRSFAEAVERYLRHQPRGVGTVALVRRLLIHFGETPLSRIDADAADLARHAILRPDHAPATALRNVIGPLSAILAFAAERGWCDPPRLDAPQASPGRTVFMLPEQLRALHAAAAPHLRILITAGICAGPRADEMFRLDWRDVDLAAGRALLWEGETKSGGRRVMRLPPAAVAALAGLPHRDGAVIRTPAGLPYPSSRETGAGGQVKTAWAAAMRRAGLAGFTPHTLRHSWATWHYAIHRDLLRLRDDGGWATVKQVERYAHIMPSGHEAAILAVWGMVDPHEARTGFRAIG